MKKVIRVSFGVACACLCAAGAVSGQRELEDAQRERGSVGSAAREHVLAGPYGATMLFPDRSVADTQLTVVVFWATWSGPSARELERLATLWPKWSKHGVRVVAVNVESSRITEQELRVIREWVEAKQLPFPVLLDRGLAAFHEYGVIAVPTTVVVDTAGAIIFRLPGYPIAGAEQLIEVVEKRVIEASKTARESFSPGTPEHRRAVRHTRLARLLVQRGELQLAEYTLNRAIKEDPRLLDARLALAQLYETQLRPLEAEEVIRDAQRTFPEDSRLLLAHAELNLRRAEHEQAEAFARRALARNQSLNGARLVLARIHLAEGHPRAALEPLFEAVKINPLDARVCQELGVAHEALGEKAGALEWYEKTYSLLDTAWTR